jgi:hypothetical protein
MPALTRASAPWFLTAVAGQWLFRLLHREFLWSHRDARRFRRWDWNKMLTVAQVHAGTLTRRNHPEGGLTAELRLPRSQRRSTHFE